MESIRWVERENYGGKDLWKRLVLSLEWKRKGVMDSDSGDDGNDERVKSDKSDKTRLHDQQAGGVPWVAYSRDRVMSDGKSGC